MTIPGNRARGVIRATGWLLVASAFTVFALLAVGPHVFGYRTLTVHTASMKPTMPPGSVALVFLTPVEKVLVGDVITFRNEQGANVTHRIVASVVPGREPVVQTQGDANNSPDADFVTLRGSVWRARAVIPWLGFAIAWARSSGIAGLGLDWGPWLIAGGLVLDLWRPRRNALVSAIAEPEITPDGERSSALGVMASVELAAVTLAMAWSAREARRRRTSRRHRLVARVG